MSLGDEDDVKDEEDIRIGVAVSGGTSLTCSKQKFVLTFAFLVNCRL